MRVRNIIGTSDNKCQCSGGWLGHWRRFSGDTNAKAAVLPCSVVGCQSKAEVGGHVHEVSVATRTAELLFAKTDHAREWLIVPLCDGCNKKAGAEFDLKPVATAPANTSKTCDSYQPY